MRRLSYILLLVIFVGVSASCVNASTDCEKWFVSYRRELAHSRNVQRIAAAKRRAKLYAQRKIAAIQPAPKPKLIRTSAPHMTRKETLHHFDLACGILPEGGGDEPLVAEESPADFDTARPADTVDVVPAGLGDMIAENTPPPGPSLEGNGSSPFAGGPPVFVPPYTGGGGGYTSSKPVAPPIPPVAPPVPPVTPPIPPVTPPIPPVPPIAPVAPVVPEPSSYVLMLTGLTGAVGAYRRRLKA